MSDNPKNKFLEWHQKNHLPSPRFSTWKDPTTPGHASRFYSKYTFKCVVFQASGSTKKSAEKKVCAQMMAFLQAKPYFSDNDRSYEDSFCYKKKFIEEDRVFRNKYFRNKEVFFLPDDTGDGTQDDTGDGTQDDTGDGTQDDTGDTGGELNTNEKETFLHGLDLSERQTDRIILLDAENVNIKAEQLKNIQRTKILAFVAKNKKANIFVLAKTFDFVHVFISERVGRDAADFLLAFYAGKLSMLNLNIDIYILTKDHYGEHLENFLERGRYVCYFEDCFE